MTLDRERKLSWAIVLFTIVAQAFLLWPETYLAGWRDNDAINHYSMTGQMVKAIEQGANPLDFWSPEVSMGVPMVRTYQPLAHILVAAAYFAFGKSVSLMTLLMWARFLSALVLPLGFFAAMSMLEFPPLTAAAGALLLPMIAGPGAGAMGLDLRSWAGFGIYPQAVATNLLFLAIGFSFQAVRKGKNLAITGALLGLTCLAHLMYGWMGAIAACLMALMPDAAVPRKVRITRTIAVGAVAAILTVFQLLPLYTDGYLINRARFEPAEKFDSYGAAQILQWLFTGEMLDHDRLAALTLLCFFGAGLLVWRWRKTRKLAPQERFVLVSFMFWLLLFFGRSTWGIFLVLLGVGRDFHLHRLLAIVQIFLLMLGAIGLASLWDWVARRWSTVAAGILTLALLAPMVVERVRWFNWHEGQSRETLEAVNAEMSSLDSAISLAERRGGRVYAGLPSTWANAFKVGYTTVSAFLVRRAVPAVSFAYNASVFPADVMAHFDETKPELYRLFNIRTVLGPQAAGTPEFLKPVSDFGRFRVYDAAGAGYFGLVDVAGTAAVNRETVDDVNEPWLKSDWLQKDQYIWLDFDGTAPKDLQRLSPGAPLPPTPAISPAGAVTHEEQTGQVYEADFEATRPAYALFRMTYHFCWKAYIDGQPQKTMMLTPGFLGVAAPQGKHHILCRYEPGNAKLWEVGIGVLLTLLLILTERTWGRRLLGASC
jgi:hypothetical protein